MAYKISVITINYNDKKGLQKTFDSVFNQTFKDFEYLVIDGNSNDGCKDLIEENTSRINYWLSEKDTGVYNAMNKGIKVAKGEYLIFMNSGDAFFDENVLEKANEFINGDNDIYYGDAIFLRDNKNEEVVYNQKIDFNFFRKNNFCHQATFIKKQLFEDNFYYNENLKIVSDWEFFIYIVCLKNAKIKHFNAKIALYDMKGISSNIENKNLIIQEREQTYKKYFSAFIADYEGADEFKTNRFQDFYHIKKNNIAWKVLKGFTSIILIFLPKRK